MVANRNTRKPIIHISFNPSPQDNLSDGQLTALAKEYMDKMGYAEQPYIVFKHHDIERTHLHIVSARVDLSGRKLDHDFEARKSLRICRKLEEKYRLHRATKGEISDAPEPGKVDYSRSDIRRQIASTVQTLLDRYRFHSIKEFNTLLNQYNIYAEEIKGGEDGYPYRGLVYGALAHGERVGVPIKASDIHRDIGIARLDKSIAVFTASEPPQAGRELATVIRSCVRQGIYDGRVERAAVEQALQGHGIVPIFRTNAAGRIYGATFIDIQAQTVYNGSRLGKAFSANEFEKLFNGNADPEKWLNLSRRDAMQEPESSLREEPPVYELYEQFNDGLDLISGVYIPRSEREEIDPGLKRRKRRKKHHKI